MAVLKSTGFIKINEELGLYQGEEREIFKKHMEKIKGTKREAFVPFILLIYFLIYIQA